MGCVKVYKSRKSGVKAKVNEYNATGLNLWNNVGFCIWGYNSSIE